MLGDAARSLTQTASRAAKATTSAAGAVGGAAVNGVIGGVTGAAAGIQRGLGSGSHSTAAAALALGAIGVTGLVEWPVVLAVGAGALALRQMNRGSTTPPKAPKAVPVKARNSAPPKKRKPPSRGGQRGATASR